ncbi:MAG: GyrI-like domain-containing protein [Anaerolineales bacterium]|nr:GyrI-like domain-containing protein [Anaerolineales bacterium]
MKNINTATKIKIAQRPEQPTLGIRVQAPFRGMFKVVGQVKKELERWLKLRNVTPTGPFFLRYYIIDMDGEMDVEYGVFGVEGVYGDGRVTPGIIPAGRYASLVYTGSGLQGNRKLIEWAKTNHIPWDRWDDPKGDGFRARYETFLTDPKIEPRKTKWEIEVAIKLSDETD